MNPQVEAIQAQLRQIDDYERKSLLRAEEAEARRGPLRKKLMLLLVPDVPAPPMPMRTRVWGAVAMLVVVGSAAAYLLSGHAGLRARSELLLAQGKIVAAQDAQNRKERLERLRRGESLAPDAQGRFPSSASSAPALPASGSLSAAQPGSAAATWSAASAQAAVNAPLLSGHVELAPAFANRVQSDDTVFIIVRTPEDPTGLPLAQIRVEVSNLPLDFDIGPREMLGSPDRFLHADKVIVSARVSRSGSGRVKPGDLVGQSAPVAPWYNNVRFTIDKELR